MLFPVLLCSVVTAPLHAGAKTVKVFILAGQSNMGRRAASAFDRFSIAFERSFL
jgi:hypothetical protein